MQSVNDMVGLRVGLNESYLGFTKLANLVPQHYLDMHWEMQRINDLKAPKIGLDKSLLSLARVSDIGFKNVFQATDIYKKIAFQSAAFDNLSLIRSNYLRINDLKSSILRLNIKDSMLPKIAGVSNVANFSAFSKFTSLHDSVNMLSVRLTDFHSKNRLWDELEELAEISTETVEFAEQFSALDYVTKQNIEDLKQNILNQISSQSHDIRGKISNINNDRRSIINFWIGVVGLLLAAVGEIRNHIPKPEGATKSDIETLNKTIHEILKPNAIQQNLYRKISRNCKVYMKPCSNSSLVTAIDSNNTAIVLQTLNDWFYISYIDEKDSLVKNGWVLKKYIQRLQQ